MATPPSAPLPPILRGDLRQWLASNLVPIISLKASSPSLQSAVESLLTPHSTLARVAIRTPTKAYILDSLTFSFQPPPVATEASLKQVIKEHPPAEPVDFWLGRGPRDERDARAFAEISKLPWYHAFRRNLYHLSTSNETGDSLTVPLAVCLACAASEPHLVSTFRALASEHGGDAAKIFIVVGTELPSELVAAADVTPLVLLSPTSPQSGASLLLQTALDLGEKRMQGWHLVAGRMKGLRNALKSWFGRPEASPSQTQDAAKVRQLADTLFLLRDYELAMQTYAVVRDDYIACENPLRAGSALEMMALCALMQRGDRLTEYVERAMEQLAKAKPAFPNLAPRLITRCALLLVDAGEKSASLRALLKASSGETDLGAAVVSEQTGLALLHAGLVHVRGGLVRKFGFQMVMAGSLFRTCGLERHALRCLASVSNLFTGSGWPAAEQHLDLQIGSLALALKDDATAQRFRGRVLERGLFGPVVRHEATVLKDWADCTARLGRAGGVRLPRVLDAKAVLAPPAEEPPPASLLGAFKGQPRLSARTQAFAGEPLCVELGLVNPLHSPLVLAGLQLEVEPAEHVRCAAVDLELAAGETRWVRLELTPSEAGETLRVVGARWTLLGCALVEHRFARPGPLLGETKAQIVARARAPDESLQAHVQPAAPCLRATVTSLDPAVGLSEPCGAVFLFRVALSNEGARACGPVLAAGDALDWAGGEVLDDKVSRLPLSGLGPGERAELDLRVLAGPEPPRALLRYGDGRCLGLRLPVPCGPQTRLAARVDDALRLVLQLEDDSHSISPLKVHCLASGLALAPLAPPQRPWVGSCHMCFQLQRRPAEATLMHTAVALTRGDDGDDGWTLDAADPLLAQALFRAHEERRAARKAEAEARRAELAALGQLPVSIQDVRRMRRHGVMLTVMGGTEPSLADEDQVHVCVTWRAPSGRLGLCYLAAVPVPSDAPCKVSLAHAASAVLRGPFCSLDVEVLVEDVAGMGLLGAVLSVEAQPGFRRPSFWLGKSVCVLDEIPRRGAVRVQLKPCFASAGVFAVGPVKVRVGERDFYSGAGYVVIQRGESQQDEATMVADEGTTLFGFSLVGGGGEGELTELAEGGTPPVAQEEELAAAGGTKSVTPQDGKVTDGTTDGTPMAPRGGNEEEELAVAATASRQHASEDDDDDDEAFVRKLEAELAGLTARDKI